MWKPQLQVGILLYLKPCVCSTFEVSVAEGCFLIYQEQSSSSHRWKGERPRDAFVILHVCVACPDVCIESAGERAGRGKPLPRLAPRTYDTTPPSLSRPSRLSIAADDVLVVVVFSCCWCRHTRQPPQKMKKANRRPGTGGKGSTKSLATEPSRSPDSRYNTGQGLVAGEVRRRTVHHACGVPDKRRIGAQSRNG